MSFFTSGLFWFLEGVFACLMIVGLKAWTADRDIPMPFWKWLICGVWLILAGFSLAFVGTCLGEREYTAAIKGGILFGVMCVVTGAGAWRLLLRCRTYGEAVDRK